MKLLTIVGARPQFIKAAAVSRAIAQWNTTAERPIDEKIIHTGQHYDPNMSDVFFEEMQIPRPYRNLEIGSGSHGKQTADMLSALEQLFIEEAPDAVLIYGDTNSTLAGALAASKLHIPLIHVEAGLRSYLKRMPEEQNRIVADHLSSLLLCPTQAALDNLAAEGFALELPESPTNDHPGVLNVGDVMYDSVLFYAKQTENNDYLADQLDLTPNEPFLLTTIHRAENTDIPERMESILTALNHIAKTTRVIWPIHPRTRKVLSQQPKLLSLTQKLQLIDPVSYREMVWLLSRCQAVCSDSGGLQKEAYFLKKPSVIMKDRTEWVETIDIGWSVSVGSDGEKIQKFCEMGLNFTATSKTTVSTAAVSTAAVSTAAPFSNQGSYSETLYGDGDAAGAIVRCIAQSIAS